MNIQALDVLVRFRGLWDIFFRSRRVSIHTLNVRLSCHEYWILVKVEFEYMRIRRKEGSRIWIWEGKYLPMYTSLNTS